MALSILMSNALAIFFSDKDRGACVINIVPRFSCWTSQRPLPPTVHGGRHLTNTVYREEWIGPIPGTVKWAVNSLKSLKRRFLGALFNFLFFNFILFCENWKGGNNKEKWCKKCLHIYIYISTSFSLCLQKFLCYCNLPFLDRRARGVAGSVPKRIPRMGYV